MEPSQTCQSDTAVSRSVHTLFWQFKLAQVRTALFLQGEQFVSHKELIKTVRTYVSLDGYNTNIDSNKNLFIITTFQIWLKFIPSLLSLLCLQISDLQNLSNPYSMDGIKVLYWMHKSMHLTYNREQKNLLLLVVEEKGDSYVTSVNHHDHPSNLFSLTISASFLYWGIW